MSPESPDVSALERALVAVASAPSASEALDRLVEGSLLGAPRVALFLVRHRRVRGWRSAGHDPESTQRLGRVDLAVDEGWLGRAVSETSFAAVEKLPGELVPRFGQKPCDEAVALALRVGDTPMGFLVAERSRTEEPWSLFTLRLLAVFCRMRLELDFLRRKGAISSRAEASPGASSASSDATARSSLMPNLSSGSRGVADPAPTGLAPLPAPSVPAESSRNQEARRFARLIATDIRLYNEEAVLSGRRQRDLTRRLGDQIERGKESFLRRFSDLGPQGLTLLEEAYLEVLAAGDPAALTP